MIEELERKIIRLEEEHMTITNGLEKIDEEIYKLGEQLSQSSEKIDRGSRLQYKTANDIIGKIKKLDYSIKEKWDFQTKYEFELKQKENLVGNIQLLVQVLLKMLDDIDIACDKEINNDEDNWYRLHKMWEIQIMETFDNIGIKEIEVLGTTFDPLLSEAIDTMTLEEIRSSDGIFLQKDKYLPFEVVKVVRRGFMLSDGSLLRKAKVITIKEERGYEKNKG
jgi:molecular chaperone GrpE (heat shock protein)